ncbi:MAG: cytochrome P450 [Actinomycetota bacterium]|nr:cytochrome P450 [Actinomycetota bacterium]
MASTTRAELDGQLTSPAFYADPYPFYHRLRETDPVHWSDANGGWMLTRYDDVLATVRDHRRFSSRGRFQAALERIPADVRARVRSLEDHYQVGLIASDPPDHTRMRGLVNMAFTPRIVEQLRPRVQVLVDELLDAVQDRGEMDVIRDLAYPLPATVIAELFGAPAQDRDRFKAWSGGILAFQGTGNPAPEVIEGSQRDLLEMRAFLSDLAEERRRSPRDDLLSRLVAAEGDKLSEAELLTTCVTLLTAGHETTTNLIGNGLFTLLRTPDQLRLLRANPELMPTAVEEMLRYESPLQRNPRCVTEDVELGGKRLRRGDYVMQVLGAANRDSDQFPDPDRFDITRHPNRHVAFGFGIHFCIGAPLARLEAPVAIGAILRRMPRLRLVADAVRWQEHGLLRGLTSLPAIF